nr:hypothetical protein B0A51_00966 [Rachicladosporium sp. CCFEE 5018]
MRSATTVAVLATATSILADKVSLDSSKRGLCYVKGENAADDAIWDNANGTLTWYYNYQAQPTSGIDDRLQFVPMLWGTNGQNSGFYKTVKGLMDGGRKIEYVLGFNEPDGCSNGGSCINPQVAASMWRTEIEPLKELGVRLGAPAVTGSPQGFTWLENFFAACDGGCTADFIPVHWYGNFEGLASHMGQVNASYPNQTMWITEFGLPQQSAAATTEFFNQSLSYFDRTPFVTHYSWFGAFRADVSNVGPNSALLTSKGQLTNMGASYVGLTEAEAAKASSASSTATIAGWSMFVDTGIALRYLDARLHTFIDL